MGRGTCTHYFEGAAEDFHGRRGRLEGLRGMRGGSEGSSTRVKRKETT